jgi:D-alanyl-D-alanine carboxypeptidase
LLGQIEGVDGIKTGYTRASGFNLASSAERDGRRVIVVVMGGETAAARDAQVAYLIEGAFEEFARREQPGATRFVGLRGGRLDAQLAPGAISQASNNPRPLPPSPYQVYQGMVVETLSPVRAPLETPTGQGDESELSTEEE